MSAPAENEHPNLMGESEEDEQGEDEQEQLDEEEDEQGFLQIDNENFDHDNEDEEDDNNNVLSSEHDISQFMENEDEEQSESEDEESDSESNEEDLSGEEHFSEHENGGFPIDSTERQFDFDLNSPDTHINHLRDSMQQPTQYEDNFDMHMNHYLDPSNLMVPGFDVVQFPTSVPTTTMTPATSSTHPGSQEPIKAQKEDKPRRGRVAKSKLLAQAETVFKDSLKNLKSERDVVNFLRFVDHFLSSSYSISLFEVRRPVKRAGNHTSVAPSSGFVLPRRKFPKRALSITTILQSPESPLVRLNLREIINYKTFNLLEPHEKDSLLQHLPRSDKGSKDAVESMFSSHAFLSNLPTFQEMLGMGEFENSKDEFLQYVKGKKKRETMESWKEKYYEEYWGQRLKNKEQIPDEIQPTFSFVEWCEQHADEDLSAIFPTHSFISSVDQTELSQLEEEPTQYIPGRRGRKKKHDSDDFMEAKVSFKRESENDNFVADDNDEEDEDGQFRKRKREKRSDRDYAPIGKVKREKSSSGNSFRHCAYEILLREQRPLSAADIIKIALKEGLITTTGKTPQNTLASVIYCEMKKDPNCSFTKVGPMTFGLKEFKYKNTNNLDDEGNKKKKKKKKLGTG